MKGHNKVSFRCFSFWDLFFSSLSGDALKLHRSTDYMSSNQVTLKAQSFFTYKNSPELFCECVCVCVCACVFVLVGMSVLLF